MGRNTSVVLGHHFEKFVGKKISEGRFKNASEVIRAGLRLLEDEENKIEILREALKVGIDGGMVEDFDPKKHLEMLKKKNTGNND
ncbi:type II toxin-antitoxin system ParD family antitoxin [Pedobacter borealis]|uniref:type II toxin-antitoxin system ParD family antitoxin n=1 Tax=Pedobacter borealis TaxID=475254 RepID=UPI0004931DF0|nr:type II toxin-antitoxin system ParD family antitoxin [Pedobacter borealis]